MKQRLLIEGKSNNTFNVNSPLANLFVDWFQEIFELENK